MRAETPDNRRVLAVRVHVNYFIEVYQPDHLRGTTANKGEKLLHATIKPKANSPVSYPWISPRLSQIISY